MAKKKKKKKVTSNPNSPLKIQNTTKTPQITLKMTAKPRPIQSHPLCRVKHPALLAIGAFARGLVLGQPGGGKAPPAHAAGGQRGLLN
jgi:hypothetical protein